MTSDRKRIAAGVARGMVPVAAGLLAVWSAPAANADIQYDGNLFMPSTGRQVAAHWHLTGVPGEVGRPSGTITDASGCAIDTIPIEDPVATPLTDGESWFMAGHVTSGGGPNCLDTSRLLIMCMKNKPSGRTDIHINDAEHNDRGWVLNGSEPCF